MQWDARQKTLTVKGDTVHLKIYSGGKIEKWSEEGGEKTQQQYPIIIEPLVPVPHRQQGK